MDDDIIERLIAAVGLLPLSSLVNAIYLAAYLRAIGYRAPTPESAKLQSLLSHADRALWQSIAVARAQALAEEDAAERQAPGWLTDLWRQRPAPTDDAEEEEKGIGP